MFILTGAAWGIAYISLGEPLAGTIPLTYAIISSLSVAFFALTRRFGLFRTSQLALILFLPFLLMVALGGFINSSAVILWSFICPLGALLFAKHQHAPYWLLGYLALLILSGFPQPFTPLENQLPEGMVIAFFVLNIGGVFTIAFILLHYFVGQKKPEHAIAAPRTREIGKLVAQHPAAPDRGQAKKRGAHHR